MGSEGYRKAREREEENGQVGPSWDSAVRRKGGQAGGKMRVCWKGMCWGTGQAVEGGEGGQAPICFGTYNIRNGHNGCLESALRGVGKSNVDMGVFQETKLTYGI